MLKCHCACTPEIGTWIINDTTGRQTTHKNNENARFFGRITFYAQVLKVYINFKRQKNFFKKSPKSMTLIPLKFHFLI